MDIHVYPDTLRRLPVDHRWRSVRWAAGDRWCSRPGTSRGPRPGWPPAGPSSAPPGSRTRRAAPRSPQSEPSLGSQLRSPGCNEPSPEGDKFSVFTVNMWVIFNCITSNFQCFRLVFCRRVTLDMPHSESRRQTRSMVCCSNKALKCELCD